MTTQIPRASNRSRLFVRLLLTATLVLVGGVVTYAEYGKNSLAKARESFTLGPLDFAEFQPDPLPEGTANGTDFEESAALLVEGQSMIYSPRQGQGDAGLLELYKRLRTRDIDRMPSTAEELEFFDHQVERLRLPLEVLDAGLGKTSRAQYYTSWDVVPFELEIPNLLIRLRFSSLIRARAELAMVEGRWQDAWQDAAKIQRLAAWSMESLPTLINALVARAIAQNGFFLVERLLAGPAVDPQLRLAVLEEASRHPISERYSRIIDAERAAAFNSLIHPDVDSSTLAALSQGRPVPESLPGRRSLAVEYLRWTEGYFERCKGPSRKVGTEEFKQSLQGFSAGVHNIAFDCLNPMRKRDLAIASLDQLKLALELEKMFERNGHYPHDLSVIPDLPSDPFSGRSYGYQVQADGGYKLWSVSFNGQDDGGALPAATPQGGPEWSQGDLVWWVRGKS